MGCSLSLLRRRSDREFRPNTFSLVLVRRAPSVVAAAAVVVVVVVVVVVSGLRLLGCTLALLPRRLLLLARLGLIENIVERDVVSVLLIAVLAVRLGSGLSVAEVLAVPASGMNQKEPCGQPSNGAGFRYAIDQRSRESLGGADTASRRRCRRRHRTGCPHRTSR